VKLTREQTWELRQLERARRKMVKERLHWLKRMDSQLEGGAQIRIEELDREIAAIKSSNT
jgi:hypothetical protein